MLYQKHLLPALERNILKHRAFEMIIILFYAEHLKKLILGIIQSTDKIFNNENPRIPSNKKEKLKEALKIFVNEDIITIKESEEIQYLINYRNIIAHEVQNLTSALPEILSKNNNRYNINARKLFKYYIKEIPKRIKSNYVIPISLDPLFFLAAEKTYEKELKCLDKKIRKQIKIRKNVF